MKNKKEAEKLAEEALKSIDQIEAVEVNDFLFTRIQNRLDIKISGMESGKLRSLYRLAAMLVLFTAINLLSFDYLTTKSSNSNKQKSNTTYAFAKEYNLSERAGNY